MHGSDAQGWQSLHMALAVALAPVSCVKRVFDDMLGSWHGQVATKEEAHEELCHRGLVLGGLS